MTDLASYFPMLRLPEEEKDAERATIDAIMMIHELVDRFAAALALYDQTEVELNRFTGGLMFQDGDRRNRLVRWLQIAARDGAFTIFHLGKALQFLSKTTSGSPTLAEYVSRKHLKAAREILNSTFPDADQLRDAIGHVAEIMTDPRQDQKHSAKTDQGGSILQMGNLQGRRLVSTMHGKQVSYELSAASLKAVEAIRDEVVVAVKAVENRQA